MDAGGAEPAESAPATVSSWLGGYVSLPSVITGAGSAPKTYTAYHIITIFSKYAIEAGNQKYEVDRRFSDFEKLLVHLRKLPVAQILPDLPKKRYFNSSE